MSVCRLCEKVFSTQYNLNKHLRNVHNSKPSAISYDYHAVWTYQCLEENCKTSFQHAKGLREHLIEKHAISLETEEFNFETSLDFKTWKSTVENKTKSNYSVSTCYKGANSYITYYNCNRSGKHPSKINSKRLLKSQGSCKLNRSCPSQIIKKEHSGKKLIVTWHKTHYGHELEIQHLRLPNQVRSCIASKLISGVSASRYMYAFRVSKLEIIFCDSRIVDSYRDNVSNKFKRVDLLTRQDVHNIKKSYNIEIQDGVRHKNDAVSIDMWVNESKGLDYNPVLLYKRQGEEMDKFAISDFCLIIMNDIQENMLREFGSKIITIDNTHGLNNYDYELTSLLIIDEFGEGFPVALMFSNRQDTCVFTIFFQTIREKVEKISTKTFMSDVTETFYNAWEFVMGPAINRLYCSWHIDRAWQKNLSKILCKEKCSHVYKTLKVLQQTLNNTNFKEKLENAIKFMLEDEETRMFGNYFQTYNSRNFSQWAYCYRKSCGINTNMHIESMHKTIKYYYLQGKKVRRLDKGLHAILKYVRNKSIERLIKLSKGKHNIHLRNNIERHKVAQQSSFEIKNISSSGEWEIHNRSSNAIYTITKQLDSMCCNITCPNCNICLHSYSCTCLDYYIKTVICKHIHYIHDIISKSQPSKQSEPLRSNFDIPSISSKVHQSSCKVNLKEKILAKASGVVSTLHTMDFDNVDGEIASEIYSHLNNLSNLLSLSNIQRSSFKDVSTISKGPAKKIEKQGFYSTRKKRRVAENMKKPSKQQTNDIIDFLNGQQLIISNNANNDHNYAKS